MLRVCEYEFVSVLTDKKRVARMVNAYPFSEEFTAVPVPASGKRE
jgi:hypothetical protein